MSRRPTQEAIVSHCRNKRAVTSTQLKPIGSSIDYLYYTTIGERSFLLLCDASTSEPRAKKKQEEAIHDVVSQLCYIIHHIILIRLMFNTGSTAKISARRRTKGTSLSIRYTIFTPIDLYQIDLYYY